MKQHISKEDLLQLSPEQQEKLRVLHKWESGDFYVYKDYDYINKCYKISEGIHDEEGINSWNRANGDCLPLLNIGQMIELLEFKIGIVETCFGQQKHWYIKMINGNKFEDKELIDALWQAVKEIL